jgi:hypothetical protein
MVLNSYILYKKNIPQDTRPVTPLDYMIKITEPVANKWLQGRKYAVWLSGRGAHLIWEMTQNT